MASTNENQNTQKLVKAHARDLRIAPRKLRLVSNMVRGMRASDALAQLEFSTKKAAPIVSKLIRSAVANAQNNFSMDPESMFIKNITCDMGRVMKRYFPRARGSAFVIRRKMAHLNIELIEKKQAKKSRFQIPKKAQISEEAEEEKKDMSVEQGSVEEKKLPKRVSPKASDQVKANTVTQKRRLFNRKSGE